MEYMPLKLMAQCLAQRKASYINESVIIITRKNPIYAGSLSFWESSGARVCPWGGAGSLPFIIDPGDLVALVPAVIDLKPSPSSCPTTVLWDPQCLLGGCAGPVPVRAQVQVLVARATVKFWTPGMAPAVTRQNDAGSNSRSGRTGSQQPDSSPARNNLCCREPCTVPTSNVNMQKPVL